MHASSGQLALSRSLVLERLTLHLFALLLEHPSGVQDVEVLDGHIVPIDLFKLSLRHRGLWWVQDVAEEQLRGRLADFTDTNRV